MTNMHRMMLAALLNCTVASGTASLFLGRFDRTDWLRTEPSHGELCRKWQGSGNHD